jgi:hypothetical protein
MLFLSCLIEAIVRAAAPAKVDPPVVVNASILR